MARAPNAVPTGHHSVTPQLTLDDAVQAIEWYKKAFGPEETNSPIMLNDALMGAKSPKSMGGSPASFWVYVEDCAALFNRAVAAGARPAKGAMGAMADQFWGDRAGTLTDPQGYSWTIATHKEDLSREEMKRRQDEFMKSLAATH